MDDILLKITTFLEEIGIEVRIEAQNCSEFKQTSISIYAAMDLPVTPLIICPILFITGILLK